MSYTNRYEFQLDINSTITQVYPVYDSNATRVFERPPNEQYYDEKFTGKLTFLKDSFSLIQSESIETNFVIIVSENISGTVTEIYRGKFTKTDCTLNYDKQTATVTPETVNSYTKVNESKEKEFDLIELGTPLTSAEYLKNGIFQFYIAGKNILTNLVGENYWEQEVDSPTTDQTTLETEYFFDQISKTYWVNGHSDIAAIIGEYTVNTQSAVSERYIDTTDTYIIAPSDTSGGGVVTRWGIFTIQIALGIPQPDTLLFNGEAGNGDAFNTLYTRETGAANGEVRLELIDLYGRLLTEKDAVNGATTDDLYAVDIIAENFNYTKVLPSNNGTVTVSTTISTTAASFGVLSANCPTPTTDTYYYQKPTSSTNIHPICRSEWGCVSVWLAYDSLMLSDKEDASTDVTLTSCFEVGHVIKTLLAEIDSSLTFDQSVTNSSFLYSLANPISGLVNPRILITPKSNVILSSQLDRVASKATIKLSQILRFLRYAYNLYWHIDGSNFIIEHTKYYDNGGHYTTEQKTDFTNVINAFTGKAWSYRTNEVTFEKQEMPEQIRFKWMDNVSFPFEGYPIEITSQYVQKGNIEERNFGIFTSDIDYIQATPSDVSKEGFAVLVINGTNNKVQTVEVTVGAETYDIQNGYASLAYLIDKFHRHGLPATNIKINDTATTATTIKRLQIQNIQVTTETEPNTLQLFETDLGTAKIGRAEVSMSFHAGTTRRNMKLQLKYDTES